MAVLSFPGIHVAVFLRLFPKNKESNADYRWISKKERESLMKNIGVETRRVAEKGTTTSDLCVIAAEKLMDDLKWDKGEVELLIFVSQSRDYLVPTTACIIQHRLGLPHSVLHWISAWGVQVMLRAIGHCRHDAIWDHKKGSSDGGGYFHTDNLLQGQKYLSAFRRCGYGDGAGI